jgi:ribosomal protein S18 acetylase RimI-like enzyme
MRVAKVQKHDHVMHPFPVIYREEVMPADAESVREIIESHDLFSRDEVELAMELVQERLLKGVRSGYQFLFAERTGRVIGYSCFGPIPCTRGSYDLYWIAVHHDLRGMGIGKELLKQSEHMIAGQGGRTLYIDTSSRREYDSTRSFYERCGYHQEAFLKDFYFPGDGKIIYVKSMLNQT